MASAPPPAPAQPTPPQLESSPPTISWEGEKMFNIYIYDYCYKRGFRKTAQELLVEAELPPDSTPPINARQGLLFEWWSVFWVLFTAKASGQGSEEAMLYTQHQANQLAQRQASQRTMQPGQAPPAGQQPPHQQINRGPNGVPSRSAMMAFPSNGMPNGVGPPPPGYIPQTNGIPQPGPPQGMSSAQGQSFQPPRSSLAGMPNQQPPPQQPPQQQRGPNSNVPFQSPSMGSPQNPSGPPQHPQQHTQPPMSQLGPSPHLPHMNRPGMLPPNQGMNPMNPQGPPGAGAPPQMQYPQMGPQMGRSPSRAATPSQGQGGMLHPSPSMANRQPPGSILSVEALNAQLMLVPQGTLAQISRGLGIEARDLSSLSVQEKSKILDALRRPAPQPAHPGGVPPDNASAGPSNQMMMQNPGQQRNPNPQQRNQQQPLQRGKRNSTSPGEEHENIPHNSSPPANKRLRRSPLEQSAVPPTMNYNTQQPQNHPQQPGQMMMNPPGGPPMMGMRPQGPGSMTMNGGGPAPPHHGQPPMGGGPMSLGGMGMGPGPGPAPGPGPQPPMMQGMQHMGGAGGLPPNMGPPGSLTPHMQNQQMQAREATIRHPGMMPKGPQPGGMGNMNVGSPPSTDPSQFNLGVGPQLGPGPGPAGFNQNQNRMQKMGPPPSPALNGPPKDQKPPLMPGGAPGPGNAKNPMQNMPANHSSPRNPPPPGVPGQPGSASQTPTMGVNGIVPGPSTPVPGNTAAINSASTPGPGSMGGPPPPPPPPSGLGDPGGPGSMGGLGEGDLFSTEFIQTVTGLDVFDPRFLEPTGDINFERDFGQWFNNPDDGMTGLDMK
ncbi:hypothetical protein C0993_011594 [Termitomyces sp. T159_Od127]|nr:hypothetical protein C0993_011594 [Termitomyces sp. T159_Od127]